MSHKKYDADVVPTDSSWEEKDMLAQVACDVAEDRPTVVTLGCRLNAAESDLMKTWAEQAGLKRTIIVNTCAVTTTAERQGRQIVRQLRRQHPDAYIVATGCAVQLRPQAFGQMPELDRVIGNQGKASQEEFLAESKKRMVIQPLARQVSPQLLPHVPMNGRAKAFVQVQNGCDHFCSFCTIALARGRSRSVPPSVIVHHIQDLLNQGVQEIVLTGVDLTSYAYQDMHLGGLIQHLLQTLPDLQRLRLSSLDSIEIDDTLFHVLTNEKRLLPHVHLSLQSGSNTILKSMRRRHDREHAVSLGQRLKKERPELALGADLIAGFPGETEEMFQETMDLIHEASLDYLHVFPFSPRPGTPAARMNNQISPGIAKARAARLRSAGETRLTAWLSRHIHRTVTVLSEKNNRGHSDDFSMVHFTSSVPPDRLIPTQIIGQEGRVLIGRPI